MNHRINNKKKKRRKKTKISETNLFRLLTINYII